MGKFRQVLLLYIITEMSKFSHLSQIQISQISQSSTISFDSMMIEKVELERIVMIFSRMSRKGILPRILLLQQFLRLVLSLLQFPRFLQKTRLRLLLNQNRSGQQLERRQL